MLKIRRYVLVKIRIIEILVFKTFEKFYWEIEINFME